MEQPEKNTETFSQTLKRAIVTTTIVAIILFLLKAFPTNGRSNLSVFGTTWAAFFCIYFGGHWLEVLFVNYLKFILPKNILLLYTVRICYWFLSSILLFTLASIVFNFLSHKSSHLGNWWTFGFLYIGIQLVVYAIMQARFNKSFYNGVY